MEISEQITRLRRQNQWTQEDLAGRLYVTRQAISRWENGEALPGLPLVEKLMEVFHVSADELLGCSPQVCQSCGAYLEHEASRGTEEDGTYSPYFCSYCRQKGAFTQETSVAELAELNLASLKGWLDAIGHPCDSDLIRNFYLQYLPTLQRWSTPEPLDASDR